MKSTHQGQFNASNISNGGLFSLFLVFFLRLADDLLPWLVKVTWIVSIEEVVCQMGFVNPFDGVINRFPYLFLIHGNLIPHVVL